MHENYGKYVFANVENSESRAVDNEGQSDIPLTEVAFLEKVDV